jgi:peptidoglycan/LPS O-acetylase OafA/YrhL
MSTNEQKNRNELFLAFSIKKNFNEIISTKTNDKEITTLHGIRFINTMLILVCHKCMEIHYHPIANRTMIKDSYQMFFSVPLRASYVSTELFLMLSGLLTTYSLVGRFNKGQNVSILREILARYLRYMPPVTALILFYIYILPIIGSGPMWPLLVSAQSELCKKYSWRNFLMIHNWFPFEEMCSFNLHHIGSDFVLFVCAIILIVKLHKRPKLNVVVFATLAIVSNIARFYVTYVRELSPYIRYGVE